MLDPDSQIHSDTVSLSIMDNFHFLHLPPVTVALFTCVAFVIVLVSLDVVYPFQLVFSPTLVFEQRQYWRLITTFLYFGQLNLQTLLELHWVYTVSRLIEEQYFHRRSADYAAMLITIFLMIASLRISNVVDISFLSYMVVSVLVYLFGRLLPHALVNFLPFVSIEARWLPLLVLAWSAFFGKGNLRVDFISSTVGHVVWFLLEVFPRISGIHVFRLRNFLRWFTTHDRILEAQ